MAKFILYMPLINLCKKVTERKVDHSFFLQTFLNLTEKDIIKLP